MTRAAASGEEEGAVGGTPRDPATQADHNLVRQTLGNSIWGERPWSKYAKLLVAAAPGFVFERVWAVTGFDLDTTWTISSNLNLSDWLSILTGSLVAWMPWSLTAIASAIAVVAVLAAVEPMYVSSMVSLAEGRPVLIGTFGELVNLVIAPWLPLLTVVLVLPALPHSHQIIVVGFGLVSFLLTSEMIPDTHRENLVRQIGTRMSETGRGNYFDLGRLATASIHLAIPKKIRNTVASIVLLALCGTAVGVGWWGITRRTPWVPAQCLVINSEPRLAYVVGDSPLGVLVLDQETRRIAVTEGAKVSISQAC